MSLINRRSLSGQGLENPNVPITADALAGLLGVGLRTSAGVQVTQDSALRLVPVLACIRLIAEAIASLPLGVFVQDGPAKRQVDGPVWLEQPNDELDKAELIEGWLCGVLSDGNAYTQLIRATSGRSIGDIVEVWPIPPQSVHPRRGRDRRLVYESPLAANADGSPLTTYDCLHIRGFRKTGQIRALSPIEYHRQAIGLGLAAEQFGAQFFGNGAQLSGVISAKDDITVNQAKIMLATWRQQHGGLQNAHEPGMLTNGATWEQISVQPDDAQFLETRGYQTADVARIYRVPPHLIGDVERSTSWGTGIEEQNTQFVVFTLTPWIVRIERAIGKLLPAGQFAKFNVAGLLRGAMKDRYDAYTKGRQWGWLSVNDILGMEDMAPVDGGDVYLSPLNMIDAADMTARPTQQRAQGALFLAQAALFAKQAGADPAAIGQAVGLEPTDLGALLMQAIAASADPVGDSEDDDTTPPDDEPAPPPPGGVDDGT